MKSITYNKGIALFFAVVIVSVGLAIAIGLSDLVLGEFFIAKDVRDSHQALYIADSGIECLLQAWRDGKWETPTVPTTINCFGQSIIMPPESGPPEALLRDTLVNLSGDTCVHMEIIRDSTNPLPLLYFTVRGQTSCIAGTRSVQVGLLWVHL